MRTAVQVYCVSIFLSGAVTLFAQEGFAGKVTGGQGGREITVLTSEELRAAAQAEEPLVISVQGNMKIGTVGVRSNKTIQGVGAKPTLIGNLFVGSGAQNVIIRNLRISNPSNRKKAEGFDGVTIRGGRSVLVENCLFKDCADGALDISHGADLVTVAWCKFEYSSPEMRHRLVMLIYGPPKKKSKGRARVTLHHNWFAKNCGSRMPAARKAHVHMFNNFFDCKDNDYATNAREDAQILSEQNMYQSVKNPFYAEDNGRLDGEGNIFRDCHGKQDDGKDKVFEPPYNYALDKASAVPDLVRARAGCPL